MRFARLADIFISYASVDQARVEPLVGHLESAGYSVWWDRQLAGGAVYARKIESEILNASVVLVVWSHDSLASQWVADEAEIGRQNNKLLPIRIDPIDAPIGFRQIQTLDFANWQGQAGGHEFEALISSCDQLIGDKPDTSPGETKPTTALSSVAVLPFLNMSSDPEQEFFSDGISEELLNLLCKIPKLKVTARTSSFAFKKTDKSIGEIGKLLGVGHILEGSVRKAGNRVRITAQLIETESGFHLWSETFDRTLDDIFAIQDEISAAIVEELEKHILGDVVAPVATRAISTDAYQNFLIGQQAFGQRTQKSLEEAKAAFEACLKIDPDFVPALINLADAHMLLGDGAICYGRMPMNQALALALPLLDKAEGLSRNSEEIHTSRAFYYCLQGDYDQAQTHAEKAISINANCSKAYRTLGFILKRGANPRAMVTRARELLTQIPSSSTGADSQLLGIADASRTL
jgi:adenylate cyclase